MDQFPIFYSVVEGNKHLVSPSEANVGVTIDLGKGLFVPVVCNAGSKELGEISEELISFREKAIEAKFTEADLSNANISISLNNEQDVVCVIPIIYPTHTCMLSLGGIFEVTKLNNKKDIYLEKEFELGVSYDHRWINGRDAIQFLKKIKEYVENIEKLTRIIPGDYKTIQPVYEEEKKAEIVAKKDEGNLHERWDTVADKNREAELLDLLLNDLLELTQKVTNHADGELDVNEMLVLTSMMIVEILGSLLEDFPSLKVSTLYSCHTINELAQFLKGNYPDEVRRKYPIEAQRKPFGIIDQNVDLNEKNPTQTGSIQPIGRSSEDIAVVGMSGRFPMAANVREFWEN